MDCQLDGSLSTERQFLCDYVHQDRLLALQLPKTLYFNAGINYGFSDIGGPEDQGKLLLILPPGRTSKEVACDITVGLYVLFSVYLI